MRKKELLLSAAILALSTTGMAQSLTSSKALQNASANDGNTTAKAQAPKKAESTTDATGYWVDAVSYYNENGQFTLTDGDAESYRADLTFNGTNVTINNFFDTSNWSSITDMSGVTGTYNSAAKTITVKTPSYSEGAGASHYTVYGNLNYYGAPCFVAVLAGNFETTPDNEGQYGLNMTDSLVFDVSDDLTTLTPRSGFGLWAFDESDGSPVGCLMFYQKNATFTKMPEGAKLAVIPDTIDFEGASVSVGASLKRNYTLVNKGLTDATVTAVVNAEGMSVAVPKTIGAGEKVAAYVNFKPQHAGAYSGSATISGNNGATSATLTFKGTVNEAPDYSQVVKQGSSPITFSNGDNYPYVITDTITGSPVAVSTNVGSNTQSQLFANFDVPEGKVGVFSWKGVKEGGYSNGVKIILNEDSVITDDTYSHGMDNDSFIDDISNTLVLAPGTYSVEYNNDLQADWFNTGDKSLRTYLWDFNLDLRDNAPHAAMLKADSLNFGTHYYDNLSVRDTLTAELVNLGSEPLQVTAIEGDGIFGGIVPEQDAPSFTSLPIAITYETKNNGNYSGKVIIKTNAGDYTVNCKASNVAIPANYQAIVKNGSFSFDTSNPYPFAVEVDTAYNSTSGLGNHNTDSYLDAYFEVPEGSVGKLSWKATNYSYDFWTFMNQTILTTGTRISLDGDKMKEIAGNGTDASSSNWTSDDLTFAPGRHVVRFYYHKADSKPKYADKLKIYDLALDVTTGINGINADNSDVVRTEIFNLSGQQQSQLQHGVNIIRSTHADGRTTTMKVLVK